MTEAPFWSGSEQSPEAVVVDGERVALPVQVRSAKMVTASFVVDAEAAQRLIAYSGLRVARLAGRAMCSLSAVKYTDSDLGPYHEVAVAFVVEPHDGASARKASMGVGSVTTFIHALPVNQVFTCHAGRDIWGFPKWVADISYTERGAWTEVTLTADAEQVLSLSIHRSPLPIPNREMAMACYSFRDSVLRRTAWTTRSRRMTARIGGCVLEIGRSHPMAVELASLGLPRRAVMSMATPLLSATFGPPRIVER